MTFRNTAAAIVVLGASTAWGQSTAPAAPSSHPRRVAAESNVMGLAENTRTQSATHQREEDMGTTLTRMHALLKQMQAKTSASSADSLGKANLEMWSLMLADLDKQYAQLKLASQAREELDARRASLYKQADARAAQAAKNAQAAGAAPAAGANAAAPASPPTEPTPAASSQN
jgi:hypothetical protein